MRKRWKRQGVYVWRVRKPHAVFGLPFIGRHFGYLGQSSSFYHRDRQHEGKDSRHPAASWSDLEPRVYRLPCLFPQWRWSRELSESAWTWLLCPVYPERKQPPWNLRKISRIRAANMREARDRRRGERSWIQRKLVDILVTSVRMIIGAALLAAVIYGAVTYG